MNNLQATPPGAALELVKFSAERRFEFGDRLYSDSLCMRAE